MIRVLSAARAVWLSICLASPIVLVESAWADPAPIPIGYVSWDVVRPGVSGQFDIVNLTGPNSSGDEAWPVLTAVSLSNLSLLVHFTDGSTTTFGQSYFSLSADGYSFDGASLPIDASSAVPIDALLTGLLSPTSVTLFDSQTSILTTSFSAAIDVRDGGLVDGDLQLIDAIPMTVAAVPEPGTGAMMSAGMALLLLARRRWRKRATFIGAAVCAMSAMVAVPAAAAVKLSTWTAPSSGTAGSDYMNVTATGVMLAAGQTFQTATIVLAANCGGAPVATMPAASIKPLPGNAWRIQFLLPATLGSGTYAVSMTGTSSDSSSLTGVNCAQVGVTAAPGGGWATLIGRDWSITSDNEAFKCTSMQVMQDVDLSAFHVVAPAGNFRLLLTLSDTPAPTGPFDCTAGTIGNHGVFMAGPGANDLALPAGAAVHLRAGQYLQLNLHLLNATAQTLNGTTEVQVRTVPATDVTAPTELQLAGTDILTLPADSIDHAFAGTCIANRSFDILALAPRMNALGNQIRLSRTTTGANPTTAALLDVPYAVSTELNYPTVPPARINAGDRLTTTCRFKNTTGHVVTYGDSSASEQCFIGVYGTPPSGASVNTGLSTPEPIYSCLVGNF